MPAKRLPWFRFWIDATAHGKVRQLDDATFRTWVELLDAAAKQPKRGRFENRKEAVAVLRRPAKHIAALIAAKLIDETPEGLVMHDWDEWQRWRQEDVNDDETTSDQLLNDSRLTRNGRANNPALRVSAEGDTETEREGEVNPPNPQTGGERPAVPKPKRERTMISEQDIEDLVRKYAAQYGTPQAVRDEIDLALNHQARFKNLNERLYVDGWLRRELTHRPAPRPANGHAAPPRQIIDKTGIEN